MHDNCSLTQINQWFFRQNLECMCSGWKTGFSEKLKIVRAKTLGRRAHHPWKTKICLATRGGLSSPAGPWKVERNTTPLPCHSNFLDLSVSIETSLFIARSGWSEHESVHICHHGLAPWCAHRPRSSRPRPQDKHLRCWLDMARSHCFCKKIAPAQSNPCLVCKKIAPAQSNPCLGACVHSIEEGFCVFYHAAISIQWTAIISTMDSNCTGSSCEKSMRPSDEQTCGLSL